MCMHVCVHVCVCVCVCVCVHVRVCVCVVCVYVCVHMCTCTYKYVCVYIYDTYHLSPSCMLHSSFHAVETLHSSSCYHQQIADDVELHELPAALCSE